MQPCTFLIRSGPRLTNTVYVKEVNVVSACTLVHASHFTCSGHCYLATLKGGNFFAFVHFFLYVIGLFLCHASICVICMCIAIVTCTMMVAVYSEDDKLVCVNDFNVTLKFLLANTHTSLVSTS